MAELIKDLKRERERERESERERARERERERVNDELPQGRVSISV